MYEVLLKKTNNFFLYILLTACTVFASIHFIKSIPLTPYLIGTFAVFYFFLFLSKSKIHLEKMSFILSLSSLILILGICFFTGGAEAPATRWLHAVFLFIFISNNYKKIISLITLFLVLVILYQILKAQGLTPENVLGEHNQFIHMASTIASILTTFTLLFFYQQYFRQSQAELKRVNERNDLIIKSSSTGIYDWEDTSKNEVYWSPRFYEILGFEPNEILPLSTSFQERINPEDAQRIAKKDQNFTGDFLSNEFRVKKKSGDEIWVEAQSVIKRDEQGNITRYVGAIKDITELKNTQLKLEAERNNALELAKAKSQFLSNMTHEIRTPLNGIIGLSELLFEKISNQNKELLDGINMSANHLLNLVNDILDYNKIEASAMKLTPEVVSLPSFLNSFSLIYEPLLEQKNSIQFNLVTEMHGENFFIDKTKLKQVLDNILGNSLKFTTEGSIDLHVLQKNDLLEFTITDTGIGIPENKQDSIFNIFEQIDSTLSKNVHGTGLGLALTKKLIELMGGEISISSQLGSGTKVSFTINAPITNKTNPDQQETLEQKNTISTNDIKVLLAEDNPLNIKIMEAHFKALDMKFTLAKNGEEAVNLFNNHQFDLIFMDMQMPIMDGISATKIIRESNGTKPFIVCFTANSIQEEQPQLFNYYLQKPVKRQNLVDIFNIVQTEKERCKV